jgi:protein-tyrosine phosphatase
VRRTREWDRDNRPPRSPWNEVAAGLWMGGHEWIDEHGELQSAVVTDQFDLVISLFTRAGHGPSPDRPHVVHEIPDAVLLPAQIDRVAELAVCAAEQLRAGRTVLVRCRAGLNRSGLVTAQTLIELGHDAPTAIALVRQARSGDALNNTIFVDYLTTGLSVSSLLSGLGS